MNKPIHIYKSRDTRKGRENCEYYQAFLAPYGMIASLHGFDIFPDGIVTMVVTGHIAYEFEVRQAFNQYNKERNT